MGEPKPLHLFNGKKIIGRQLISRKFRLQFNVIDEEFAFKKNLYAIFNIDELKFSYEFILGILNSTFFSYMIVNFNTSGQRDDFPSLSLKDFREFRIPNLSINEQKPIKNLVIKLFKNKTETIKIESQIDQLIYQLYELTEEEIKIVENN